MSRCPACGQFGQEGHICPGPPKVPRCSGCGRLRGESHECPPPAEVMHGTASGYNYHKCRCLACCDWNRDHTRKYRMKKKMRERPVMALDPKHGTVPGYRRCAEQVRAGVRAQTCQPCRKAWREWKGEYRGAVTAGRRGEQFDPMPMPGKPACTAPNVNPEWFFPVDRYDRPDLNSNQRKAINEFGKRRALKICASCDVREWCKQDTANLEYGIAAGLTERERKTSTNISTLLGPLFLEPV